jgi:hypothetical protein
MATFFKFGILWEIPPAAAALGRNLPANHMAFIKFLADLEPMLSQFICAHPLCPATPSLEPEQFMLKAAPSTINHAGRLHTIRQRKPPIVPGSSKQRSISSTNSTGQPKQPGRKYASQKSPSSRRA